jgi:hypothetical protein
MITISTLLNDMIQLRDGHHRVMATINAGEEYVCLNLDDESLPMVNEVNGLSLVSTKYDKNEE